MSRDFAIGRLRVHVWKPMHPTRFGKRNFGRTRSVSFRWFIVRWFVSLGESD